MAEKINAIFDTTAPPPKIMQAPYDTSQPAPRIELANATPNNMPQTNPLASTNVDDMNVSESAKGLYVDPSSIYQPSIDFIGQQRTQANERYAQNKADIANIFGNLTQVNKESQERVRSQFEASIADQQMKTAQSIAQARTGAEGTQRAAIRAMDERGGGPMGNLMASPAAVASERAIGDIGSYGQIWQGMQGAIQQQTQQDLQANLAALGQRSVDANMQLQRSLEDTLNTLSGQEVGVRTDLAEAIYGSKSKVAEANYNEILAKRAANEAARLAAINGQYDVEQAQIDAQNKLDLALINAGNRTTNYQANSAGVTQFIRNEGGNDQDIANFWATVDDTDISAATNSQDAFQLWLQNNTTTAPRGNQIRPSAGQTAAARLYFDGLRYNQPDETAVTERLDFTPPAFGAYGTAP